jgi:hypothetical protein
MFVVVTLACVGTGLSVRWVQNSREWIRDRREWIDRRNYGQPGPSRNPGPCGLRIFGESAWQSVYCFPGEEDEARRLFPEAQVRTYATGLTTERLPNP